MYHVSLTQFLNIIIYSLIHITQAFATLTTLQLLHSFLSRSILQSIFVAGLFGNKWMMIAFIVSFSCLLIGIYAPGIYTFK